jgi:SPP1 family holin
MDAQLIARLVISILVCINMVATMAGWNPIPYDEDSIYITVSTIVTIVTWAYGFWKNNNFTTAAKEGQKVIDEIKGKQKE